MRAWVLRDYMDIVLDADLPMPNGTGVLIRVLATGICGSDLSVFKGTPVMRNRWRPPLILGHEVVGVVEEGPAALLGQRVAIHPAIPCGECKLCLSGRDYLCPRRVQLGFHFPGGLAEYIRVPVNQVYPIAQDIPVWKGALVEPLAVCLHAWGKVSTPRTNQALVVGGGGIGGLLTWVLARSGVRVTLVEMNPSRAEFLRSLGIVAQVLDTLSELPYGEYPLVLDTVGNADTFGHCQRACTPGGQVVVLGLGDFEAPFMLQETILGERSVHGSYLFTRQEFSHAIELLQELPDTFVSLWPVERTDEAIRSLLAGKISEPKLIVTW